MNAPAKSESSCFWRHRWGKWIDKDSGNVTTDYGGGSKVVIGQFIRQERRCERCYMLDMRTAKATLLD